MAEVKAGDSGHGSDREPSPIMPHRLHTAEQLDKLYPSLEAVEAVDEESEERDELLEEGIRIAKGIVTEASQFGRRRVQRGESNPRQEAGCRSAYPCVGETADCRKVPGSERV